MTFKSLFGQFTILSLSFVTFRVSRFPVSHLTHETVQLGLQNTLNMSKTTRVYFGVLHLRKSGRVSFVRGALPKYKTCLKQFTMTTQGLHASNIMATWAPASILTKYIPNTSTIYNSSRVNKLLFIQTYIKITTF